MTRWLVVLLLVFVAGAPAAMAQDRMDDRRQEREQRMPVERRLRDVKEQLDTNQVPQAAMTLSQIKRDHPDNPDVLAYEGRILMMQNNVNGATAALNAALAKQEHHPMASALLAFIDFRMGRPAEASKRLDAAIAVHSDHPHLLQVTGQVKMQQMDFDAAESAWSKLAAHADADRGQKAQANAQLGLIYRQQGKHAEAGEAMGKALAISWVPDVALAQIQSYHQAKMSAEATEAIRVARWRLKGNQQLLQQFEAQIAPIEQTLKQAGVHDVLDGKSDMQLDQALRLVADERFRIREAEDEPTVQLRQRMDRFLVDGHLQQVNDHASKAEVSDWTAHLDELNRRVQSVNGAVNRDKERLRTAEVDAQLAAAWGPLAARYRQSHGDHPGVKAIDAGLRLQDFDAIHDEQKAKLAETGLKIWRELAAEDRTVIQNYLRIKQGQRNASAPAWESQMGMFTSSTNDERIVALAEAFAEHVKDIDLSDLEAARQAVLPDFVFTTPHTKGDPIGMGLLAFRQLSFTYWDNFAGWTLAEARDWPTIIEGNNETIQRYPRKEALRERGLAHFFAGDMEKAYHDIAAGVAVAAWERARLYRFSEYSQGNWDVAGIPWVRQLRAIANGERTTDGPYPTAPLLDALDHIENERWLELARYVAAEHPEHSFDRQLVRQVKFDFGGPKLYMTEMLDAIDAAIVATNDSAEREALDELAKAVGPTDRHPGFVLRRLATMDIDDEGYGHAARRGLLYNLRHVGLNLAYARHLEAAGQTDDARHHYNIAAAGKNAADLTGDAKAAAEARDRLEGTNDQAAIRNRYAKFIDETAQAQWNDRLLAARSEAATLRLLVLGGSRDFLLGVLADKRRGMADYTGAIETLDELIKVKPDGRAHVLAVQGLCYKEMNRLPIALEQFTAAIDAGSNQPWVYRNRGDVYRQLTKFDEAIEDYTLCLKAEPENDYVLEKRSELYEYIKRDYKNALVDAERAMEIRKQRNPDYESLGLNLRIGQLRINAMFQE